MKRFDLFGSADSDLSKVADLIARAIGVEFELHESGYHGGDYFRSRGLEGDEILVQENFEDEEGYRAEPDFVGYPTLVYVNGSSEQIARVLAEVEGLDALRSELI